MSYLEEDYFSIDEDTQEMIQSVCRRRNSIKIRVTDPVVMLGREAMDYVKKHWKLDMPSERLRFALAHHIREARRIYKKRAKPTRRWLPDKFQCILDPLHILSDKEFDAADMYAEIHLKEKDGRSWIVLSVKLGNTGILKW